MENLPELVKYFTDKGANLNIQNFNGDTPLHIAARENFDACTLILLQGNAKLDIVNHQGEIPFDYFDNVKKKEFGLEKVVIVREKKNQSKGIF
jgi:ankyrin repeat protein